MAERSAEPMPVLAAQVSDDQRDFLEGVALAGGTAHVVLMAAPAHQGPHVLQVSSPLDPSPLVLMAEPMGPPTRSGYPLRLTMAPPPASIRAPRTSTVAHSDVPDLAVGRPPSSSGFSAAGVDPATIASRLVGRSLAGGKLVIESCVGQGGAGTVFRARHRDLHMPVAVKVTHDHHAADASFAQRFQDEALSATRLDHPNLTRVLDFGQEPDGLLYIAMEFLDGRSLRDVLAAEERLDLRRALSIMIQVASALTHAHARDLVHRDIKPENLVITRGLDDDGRASEIVKVCDFGIAHATGRRALLAGTPEYMSPEQCRGEQPDAQSDVYACGVVLYELLTGRCPITANDTREILRAQLTVEPEPPSRLVRGVGQRVDRVVMKALSKAREVRHASARELRDELRAAADDVEIRASSAYFGEEERPAARSRPLSSQPPKPLGSARPPARPSPVPPADDTDDWIERGPAYLHSLIPQSIPPPAATARPPSILPRPSASIPPGMSVTPPSPDSAQAIAPFLRQLAETTDPDTFQGLVAPVTSKVRELVAEGQIATFWRLGSTLQMIAAEPVPPNGRSRAPYAQKLLELFVEPDVLAAVAERSLDGLADRQDIARKLVIRAGATGARALYTARLKHSIFEARERFVAILQEMGPPAMPVVRAALERLETRLQIAGAGELAEDLLKAIVPGLDDAMGQVVARFAKLPRRGIARLATLALPLVWGARARPLLTFLLTHTEEEVAIAAIQGLRTTGGLDEPTLRHLTPILVGAEHARSPVRIAAVEALVDTTPQALPAARDLLANALADTEGSGAEIEDFVVVICRTLLAIGGDGGLVAERWRNSTPWLRARLESLLRGRTDGRART